MTLECKMNCRVPCWDAGWDSLYEPGRVLGPQGTGLLLELRPVRGQLIQDKPGALGGPGRRAGHPAEVGAGRAPGRGKGLP